MKRQKGRPTKTEQIQIQDVIRPYFERNISSTTTSQKTGINIKTVSKYFNEWYELVVKSREDNFIKRQQKEREQIILHYETLIIEEYDLLETVKEEIQRYKDKNELVPRHLITSFQSIINSISNMTEKKGSFSIVRPIDDVIENMVKEVVSRKWQN